MGATPGGRTTMAAWFGLITLTITALATGTPAWGRQLQGTAKAPLQTHAPTATAATPLGPTASQRALDSVYVRLLERTNQQLSLWWNPYGIMVAALGALFAVLAIVAAFIIFRQSR